MTRIACIGIAVQDRLYYVAALPAEGGKYIASDYRETGGGPAATAAVAVARLGVNVDFIGRVGDDACGQGLIEELQLQGVNTAHLRQIKNARSSQSAILVDANGERIIINHPSPDFPSDASWLEAIDFSQYDLVLADVRWHEGALTAFRMAHAAGVPTLLDGDVTPQDIASLVELADHAVFSAPGLQRMTNESDPFKGLEIAATKTVGRVYVTGGSQGCQWLDQQRNYHQPAFDVEVVDTTGAGDVFHGAMAVALAENVPVAQAVRFGSAVAALKCTRTGGRDGIPDRQQTDSFLSLYG